MKIFYLRPRFRKLWIKRKTFVAVFIVLILVLLVRGRINIEFVSAFQLHGCPNLSFSKTPLPSTALASYPGAGNTWVRHLIQKMTGIATGHMFFDGPTQQGGFPGEGVKNGSVIAIKTHLAFNHSRFGSKTFQKVILIVRNPYEALLAEFRRSATRNHTGSPTIDKFKHWDYQFNKESKIYLDFYLSWLQHRDVFPLFYDDLIKDLPNTLSKLLSYLKVDGNVQCALDDPEGNFHRDHSKLLPVEFFYSLEKINITNAIIMELNKKFKVRFGDRSYDMDSWLMQ